MESTAEVRAYFTRFDRATFANADWYEEDLDRYAQELVLELKLLALLKGRVVIAASHLLESEMARTLVLNHPEIIHSGVIIPALRDDCNTVADFLDLKLASKERELYLPSEVREVQQIIDAAPTTPSQWNPHQTMEWFHHRLCMDLSQTFSVLRMQLSFPQKTIDELRCRLVDLEDVSRQSVFTIARQVLGAPNVPFTEYVDFLYYLSGAVAVQAEGVLPQENLVGFDVATDENKRERLSEMEIFYRLFMHIVRTHTQRALPIEVLWSLSFQDIAALRETTLHKDFVMKYQGVIQQSKERTTITDASQLVLRVSELETLERELLSQFNDTIGKEARERAKEKREMKALKLLGSVTSIFSVYESVLTAVDFALSALGFISPTKLQERIDARAKHLWNQIDHIVDRRSLQERAVLLKFLGQVAERYRDRLLEA